MDLRPLKIRSLRPTSYLCHSLRYQSGSPNGICSPNPDARVTAEGALAGPAAFAISSPGFAVAVPSTPTWNLGPYFSRIEGSWNFLNCAEASVPATFTSTFFPPGEDASFAASQLAGDTRVLIQKRCHIEDLAVYDDPQIFRLIMLGDV